MGKWERRRHGRAQMVVARGTRSGPNRFVTHLRGHFRKMRHPLLKEAGWRAIVRDRPEWRWVKTHEGKPYPQV